MAYGLKYLLRYETEKYHRDVQLKIYADGYSGSVINKKIGAGRIILTKDIDEHIAGTSLDFDIQADIDFEYADFFSNDNKKHKIELVYNTKKIWTGYMISDQYSEPYIAPPYDVHVMATDGLGLLKTEIFDLTGMVSRFDAIKYCIDKIGFDFGYLFNLDLWESTMNQSLHNMLDQLYFNAVIHSGKTCYEVIQKLLPQDVTITQEWGRWLIQRTSDFDKIITAFTSDGVYENDYTTQPVFELGTIETGQIHPSGSLTMEFLPAWKNFKLKNIYGKRESFLKNHDFKSGTDYWYENIISFPTDPFLTSLSLDSGTFGLIKGKQTGQNNYASANVKLKSSEQITVSIDYCPIGYNSASAILKPLQIDVVFQIELITTLGAHYYLTQNGWGGPGSMDSYRFIRLNKTVSSIHADSIDFKTLKIVASKLPADGTLHVKVFQSVLTSSDFYNTNINLLGLAIRNVLLYTQDLTYFSDTEEIPVNITNNATEEGKTIELMPCDLPDYTNADMYFDNGNFIYSGGIYVPAKLWGTEEVRYIDYMASFIANQYGNPKSILKGQIVTNGVVISTGTLVNSSFGLNARVIHPWNDNKKFTVESGTWNVLGDYFDVTMVELIPPVETIVVDTPPEFSPVNEYNNYPYILPYTSIGNEGQYTKIVSGNFEHVLPGLANGLIVSRKETITPFQLDYDSGTPQFSLKSAFFTPNYTDDVNLLRVDSGSLISHNFNALAREEIELLKLNEYDYDPTREWSIAAETITLPNNNAHFIYAVAPLDPEETAAGIMVSEDHIEPKATEGYITFKLGSASLTDGSSLRDLALLWGNGKPKDISRVQSDWTQTDDTEPDYIKHKPNYSVQALSGTAVTWDANSGMNARLTLSGNTTITLSNLVAGTSGNLTIINPSPVYTLTFAGYTNKISPSVYSAANVVTTSGGSKVDMYSWYYDGTYLVWNGSQDYK